MNIHEYIEKLAVSNKSVQKQYRRALALMTREDSASHASKSIRSLMDEGVVRITRDPHRTKTGYGSYWIDHQKGKVGNPYYKSGKKDYGLIIGDRGHVMGQPHTIPASEARVYKERRLGKRGYDGDTGSAVDQADGSILMRPASYKAHRGHHIRSGNVPIKRGMTVVARPKTVGIEGYKKTRARQIHPNVWNYAKGVLKANKEWGRPIDRKIGRDSVKNLMNSIRWGQTARPPSFQKPMPLKK